MPPVFESMTDGVVIRGKSGRIIYANEYACRLLNDGAGLVGISGRELTEKRYGTEMRKAAVSAMSALCGAPRRV